MSNRTNVRLNISPIPDSVRVAIAQDSVADGVDDVLVNVSVRHIAAPGASRDLLAAAFHETLSGINALLPMEAVNPAKYAIVKRLFLIPEFGADPDLLRWFTRTFCSLPDRYLLGVGRALVETDWWNQWPSPNARPAPGCKKVKYNVSGYIARAAVRIQKHDYPEYVRSNRPTSEELPLEDTEAAWYEHGTLGTKVRLWEARDDLCRALDAVGSPQELTRAYLERFDSGRWFGYPTSADKHFSTKLKRKYAKKIRALQNYLSVYGQPPQVEL